MREQCLVELPAGGLVKAVDREEGRPVKLVEAAQEVDGETLVVGNRVGGGSRQLGAQELGQTSGKGVVEELGPVSAEPDADRQEDGMAAFAQPVEPADDKGALAAASRCREQEALAVRCGEPYVEMLQHGAPAAECHWVVGRAEIACKELLRSGPELGGSERGDAEAGEEVACERAGG